MLTVEEIFQKTISNLDGYIISDETSALSSSYPIREIHASITRPWANCPIQEVTIRSGSLKDKCMVLYEERFRSSGPHKNYRWFLEAETALQYLGLTTSEHESLTLGLWDRREKAAQGISYREPSYKHEDGQFIFRGWGYLRPEDTDVYEFDSRDGIMLMRHFASGELVREIHVPKTIAVEPWLKRLQDIDGQILADPNFPWRNWFRELGISYRENS